MIAIPLEHVVMISMIGLCDCCEKLRIAPAATYVFRWASVSTINAIRHLRTGSFGQFLLDFDLVIPIVSKVVKIAKRLFTGQRFAQCFPVLGVYRRPHAIDVLNAVTLTANFELMQMPTLPAHYPLNDGMQFHQSNRFRHDYATPNLGLISFSSM